ncbi:DUF4230 domain-containing protein [Spirochaeta africana]|uniref:DUF4230 domain-containing protein n=1 Tax=Spirochaeta africana (strain ATCC 700263 / DSM 8902 / Z-7692) TaxID=889378 RepID=H9UMB9_SPIAZ|nr:DUF4230 domain-containing protein [Spirochaeta africana]AFG38662.1 hypothetical protein Spiaf_2636 [Spirochaeta africana DSM 8902]
MLRLPFKILLTTVIAAVVIASAAVLYQRLTGTPLLPDLRPVTRSRTAHSELLFQEARDIYQLVTAEYVVKTVFPHDFIPGGYSIERILQRVRGAREPVSELLSRRELAYLELYNLGLETGLPARTDSTRFIVFTAVLTAGYDLENTVFADPNNDSSRAVRVYHIDGEPALDVVVPSPAILSVELKDPTRETYRYPDIPVTPGQLQQISRYLHQQLQDHAHSRRLLAAADQNGRRFLQQTFEAAGYATVRLLSQQEFDGGRKE